MQSIVISSPRRTLLLGAGSAAALALAGCNRSGAVSFKGIDVTGAEYARGFALTDPDGRQRTLEEFKGKSVLVFFGFTHCPDVCPTALLRARDTKKLLGADGDKLQVVFITVDPERDTPKVLKDYTAAFDPSFIGLYSDLDGTKKVTRDFKVFFMKVPTTSSYTVDHTSMSYIYDPQGRLRLMLKHEQTAEDYASDIRQLLRGA